MATTEVTTQHLAEPDREQPQTLNAQQITKIVDADDLLFTQASCSSMFSCERSLEDLILALDNWNLDTLEANFLMLDAVEYHRNGRLYIHSLDNRRLYCLKQHQQHKRSAGWTVNVKVVCSPIPFKAVGRMELLGGGREIRIRPGRRSRSTGRAR